jgi:predicted RNA-binding Zn-ribbon protein involved in translation (DUF1610 family)
VSKTPRSGLNYRTRLQEAAAASMLIVARCKLCRRSRHYLASDLLECGYHPGLFVEEIFGPRCPHCGSSNFFRVQERYANSDDVGNTVIRRPAGERRIQLWKDEYYGPLPKGEPKLGAAD